MNNSLHIGITDIAALVELAMETSPEGSDTDPTLIAEFIFDGQDEGPAMDEAAYRPVIIALATLYAAQMEVAEDELDQEAEAEQDRLDMEATYRTLGPEL